MQKLTLPRSVRWICWLFLFFLLLMGLLRLVFVLVFADAAHPLSSLGSAFGVGLQYDARIAAIVCLPIFLLSLFRPVHPLNSRLGDKLNFWLTSLFVFVVAFMYTIDGANYAYLHQRMTGNLLNYVDDAAISFSMVWQTYPVLTMLGCMLLLATVLSFILRKMFMAILSTPERANTRSKIVFSVLCFLGLALAVFGRLGQYPLRWSDAFGLGSDYQAQVALNPFQSFFSTLMYRKDGFDAAKTQAAWPYMQQKLGLQQAQPLQFGRPISREQTPLIQPKNVVLVICESFSAYKSSAYGNPLKTTPFFDSLAAQGALFTQCFSPSYGTARGVWSILTGVPDVSIHKTASRNPSAVNQYTLVNAFTGMNKYYFLGGSTSWANIRGLLTNNIDGLKLYEEGMYKSPKVDVWGISDKNLFLEAAAVLGKEEKPFFAIIQTADNHRPYTIPKEDAAWVPETEIDTDTLRKYGFESGQEYRAFRYTDYCYRKLMEAARTAGFYENTLFVFVGDHGIKGNALGVLPPAYTQAGLTPYHIPLLYYYPKELKPGRYPQLSSQNDVLPGIAALMGKQVQNQTLGQNPFAAGTNSEAFLFDPESRQISLIRHHGVYTRALPGQPLQTQYWPFLPGTGMVNSDTMGAASATSAWYETSRYMLFNNKNSGRKP